MTRHTLDASRLRRLKRIVNCRTDQLVLDLNAVYIVGPNETTKIEALAVVPESPEPDQCDEIFPINVDITTSGDPRAIAVRSPLAGNSTAYTRALRLRGRQRCWNHHRPGNAFRPWSRMRSEASMVECH